MSKALWTISQTNTDPSAGDDQAVADPMTGLSAQWDGGLGGFLFSDETSDLGDRVFDRSGGSEGRGEIDASTAELAVNGLAEDDANSGTSPVENVLPALSQDAGTEGGAQSAAATEAPVTIADGGATVIEGPSSQSVVFAGPSGTLTLDDAQGFTGQISGLSGSDAIDLADISYNADTQVTFLGNAAGGTLTVTDGTETANIALEGDYLSSTWTLSSDGDGGVTVVDPTVSTNWQTLKVGGGGFVRGLDIAPDGTMVGRTDTNGAYLWNGSEWVQLVTSSSLPAAFLALNPVTTGTGVYEIQIASSNTQIFYMMFDGAVFKSTNQGTTWTQLGSFAQAVITTLAAGTANAPLPATITSQRQGSGSSTVWTLNGTAPDNTTITIYDGSTELGATASNASGAWSYVTGSLSTGTQSFSAVAGSPTVWTLTGTAAPNGTVVVYDDGTEIGTTTANASGAWTYLSPWTANGTQSFTVSGQVTADPNDNYGQVGQKMAIDPNNPNIVYAGTESSGMFVTTNGGTTWTSVSAIPAGDDAGITGIMFDPAIGGVVGGVTQTIFASSYGNGVYESTSGGTTWKHLNGGPSDVEYAAVSSTGVYYAVGDSNSGLWSYANGAWTELLSNTQSIQSVAVDPSNPSEVVVETPGGGIDVSYDAGKTWSGWYNFNPVSTDIPWETAANISPGGTNGTFMDAGGVAFNPLVANQLIASGGTGVWNVSVPTSGVSDAANGWQLTFNDMSAGIENLVANEIIVPPGGDPVLASWDRPFFTISNLNAYPSTYGPADSDNIVAGWSVDYASSDPGFLVGLADWWGTEDTGYSTDGGKTWTNFASDIPGAGSSFMGGTIAASTPQNIIWAPADGYQPYYTLNGGVTWSPITLPGVTSWSGFDWAYYLDTRTVTADRVLANTFYLYDPGAGVFETTNGGQSWTNVHPGYIESNSSAAGYNSSIKSVPGEAGNLFYTSGIQGNGANPPSSDGFYQSTNQGATWTAVPNVLEVVTFGFGAAAPGQSYPSIYIVGYVNNVYGIWQSTNDAKSWTQIGTYPTGELDQITTISGDPNNFGQVYVGFAGGGYAVLVAPPSVVGVTATGAGITNNAGTIGKGAAVTFTVSLTATVTVAGGAPTLSLNDGGTATYVSGSGTNALVFSYTVGSGQSASGLAITGVNLPSGVTVQDDVATAAVLTGADTTFTGLTVAAGGSSAPTIAGTLAGQKTTSEAAVKPFSGVTIADANSGASDTLTITVTGAGGTLSGTGLTGGTGGVYTLTGTAAAITSELDALSFTPKAGSPGTSSTTNFQLSDLSSAYATAAVNTTTSVVDTDPAVGGAVAPTITGTVAGQKTTSEAAVKPFSGVTIADPNSGASDTLKITVTGAGGTLSGTGLTGGTGGVYTLAGTAAAITSELDALSFTPKAGSPGTSSTTNFQLSDLSSAYATPTVNTTTSVVDTDPAGALSLSVAQATAMETAGGSAPSGDVVTLSDTAANIATLTAVQIGGLKAIGVTAIAATNASVSVSVAQAVALETAGLKISAPTGDVVTLSDTTTNEEALTAAQITGLKAIGVTVIAANASVAMTVAQAIGLETIGLKISAPTGDVVTLSDTTTNEEALTAAQITGLKAIGVTVIAANASVAMTVAQAIGLETIGLKISAPTGDVVTLSDTAANIDGLTPTQIKGLGAIGVTAIVVISGSGRLTAAQAEALETAGLKVSDPTLSDTAANIESLTATEIGGLDAIGVTAIAVTNGSVSFSVAQAMALETEGLKVTVPTGDFVTLSDTAANIEKLTATQIAGLAAIGVTAIAATNASVSLTVAQTSAVNTARLLVSAPANDAVTEHNADGSYDIVYSGITGQAYSSYQSDYNSAGVLIAKAVNDTNGAGVTTVYGNNLKISTSAGAESLTSGSDIFVYTPHAQETFSAAGTTNDIFTFKAGFGSDTISGLGAAGANADSLNLAGLFTSYASLQSHMVASGANTIITDAGGDTLTIVGLSPTALTAARVGF